MNPKAAGAWRKEWPCIVKVAFFLYKFNLNTVFLRSCNFRLQGYQPCEPIREQNSCNLIGWCGRQTWGKKTVPQVMRCWKMWSGNKAILEYIQIERIGYLLPTWALKTTCQNFNWMLQSSSEQKSDARAVSQNVSQLFSKLKLVTDNIYAGANWEATERVHTN